MSARGRQHTRPLLSCLPACLQEGGRRLAAGRHTRARHRAGVMWHCSSHAGPCQASQMATCVLVAPTTGCPQLPVSCTALCCVLCVLCDRNALGAFMTLCPVVALCTCGSHVARMRNNRKHQMLAADMATSMAAGRELSRSWRPASTAASGATAAASAAAPPPPPGPCTGLSAAPELCWCAAVSRARR